MGDFDDKPHFFLLKRNGF